MPTPQLFTRARSIARAISRDTRALSLLFGLVGRIYSSADRCKLPACLIIMPRFVKLCPDCETELHIRKSMCSCGHVFAKSKSSLSCKNADDGHRRNNATRQARKRALETDHELDQRRKANAACKAQKRSLETEHESDQRKHSNAACQIRRRALQGLSVESVIDSFITKTKQGPDFVCSSCHRLMYQQTVMPLNIEKYTKASSTILLDVFRNLYTCFDGNTWVCTTCNAALARGNMPKQALANGLKLPQIPPELSSLNALELRLISLRLPICVLCMATNHPCGQ